MVKEEDGEEYMCFKAKRTARSSVVRTLDSGGRGYLTERVRKTTAKPAPEVDLKPCVNMYARGMSREIFKEMV